MVVATVIWIIGVLFTFGFMKETYKIAKAEVNIFTFLTALLIWPILLGGTTAILISELLPKEKAK